MIKIKLVFLCFVLLLAVSGGNAQENITVRWDADPPASLTVKKSSRSNIENAVVLTKKQEDEIVKRHNLLRTVVQPTASKMRKMTWDEELARVATRYSRKCIYEHNKARSHSRFSYIGENLYISTGIPMNTALVTGAVSAWDGEKVDYDYETRKCKPGRKCGHYTQTAWDDTFKVGCGVTICRKVEVNGRIWESATLFACNYGPGGNYDRHPFKAGSSCSACDEGDTCEENLCVNPIRDSDNDGSDAAWSEWSPWSTCSKTCLGGMAKRSRTCSSFVESDCDGYASEITFSCAFNFCDSGPLGPGGNGGDAQFFPWGEWSECTKTCGNGMKIRKRKCKNKNSCSGINRLTTSCNKGDCPGPVTAVWTQWGRWEDCSVTCGRGIQKKKRSCSGSGCPGRKEQTKRCNPGPCKTIPKWSEWSRWSGCTATCGGGSKIKTRRCLTGKNCVGSREVADVCNTDRCPGVFSPWSEWTRCSTSCGPGMKTRSRKCVGGKDCRGSNADRTRCNMGVCPTYGMWSTWGPCDVTCGSGNRVRTRVCSSRNSDDCEGDDTQALECAKSTCTASGWSPWSPWTSCSVTCGGGQKTSTRVCNVGNSGRKTCSGEKTRATSCGLKKCPEYSSWSAWSSCDATCGEGTKTRKRKCENGRSCVGPSTDSRICKIADCTKSKWGPWMAWTKCSKTCGKGVHTRERQCILGNIGPPCAGEKDDVGTCNVKECESVKPDEKDPSNKAPGERGNKEDKTDGEGQKKDKRGENSGIITFPSKIIILFLFITRFFINRLTNV